jgi:hypothetical protein
MLRKLIFAFAVVIALSVGVMADGAPCTIKCGKMCCKP